MIFFFINRNFQTFDPNQVPESTPGYGNTSAYSGSFYDPSAYASTDPLYEKGSATDFDDEPPLLEGK